MSGQTPNLDITLTALKELDTRVGELWTRASLLKAQKPDMHQKVRELTLDPAINTQITKLMARTVKVPSTPELVRIIEDIKRLTSTLDGILLSPQVEDIVASVRWLAGELGIQMRIEVQSWIRNASKDATEATLNLISQTMKNSVTKIKALNLLKPQFKTWLTYKFTSLQNLRETSSQVLAWTKEIDSGIDTAMSLDLYLGKTMKEEGSGYKNAAVLTDTLYQLGISQLEKEFDKRSIEAPAYWDELKNQIKELWLGALRWIAYVDPLLGGLLDAEKVLFEKHIKTCQIQLNTFNTFLEAVSIKVHSLTELKKTVNRITDHVKSVEGVNLDEAESVMEDLKRLSSILPDPASVETFDFYLETLNKIKQDYSRWETSFNTIIGTLKNEAESWHQLCITQALSNLAIRIEKVCEGLHEGMLLGDLHASRNLLSAIYKEIKEELKERGDPIIIQAIVKVRAQKGSVSLSDLESEVKKVKSDATKEGILTSLADLESKKLVKVEVRT